MTEPVLELYPEPGRQHVLEGLYLERLPGNSRTGPGPFIYSNYITSLDGRIALPVPGQDTRLVPADTANARDWRLFQELAAQSDMLITTARYFRQADKKQAQAELPPGAGSEFDDLREWRRANGMPKHPDIAIFSASLNIPPKSLEPYHDRKIYIVTGAEAANPAKLRQLSEVAEVQLVTSGQGQRVEATTLRSQLGQLGYQRVYAIGGPSVLHTLLSGNALDRLYLTTAHLLLGGTAFDTVVTGPRLQPARPMSLVSMYLDTNAPAGAGQTMAVYDTQAGPS